jgi:hypothetical protein
MRALGYLNTLAFSYRTDGLHATVRRAWRRLFGKADSFVLIRYLQLPQRPLDLPAIVNGVLVRQMTEADVADVAALVPFHVSPHAIEVRRMRLRECLPEGFVALREGRIVGACWYADSATPDKPWYQVVRHKLIPPVRVTGGIFSLPGEKAAAWALSQQASAWLAVRGIHTIIGFVSVENRPSLVLSRMLGGRIAARQSVRYWLGIPIVHVEPVSDTDVFGRLPAKSLLEEESGT